MNNIKHLRVEILGVGDRVTVKAAIIVGEVEKLLGVCEQVVGIRGVDILEHDGSCSEGSGCLAGQIRPLRMQDAIFSAVK
jgi:hypothetical protein